MVKLETFCYLGPLKPKFRRNRLFLKTSIYFDEKRKFDLELLKYITSRFTRLLSVSICYKENMMFCQPFNGNRRTQIGQP